jgi:hypothetical protein
VLTIVSAALRLLPECARCCGEPGHLFYELQVAFAGLAP